MIIGDQGKENIGFGAKQTYKQTKLSLNLSSLYLSLGPWANHFISLSLSFFIYKMGVLLYLLKFS